MLKKYLFLAALLQGVILSAGETRLGTPVRSSEMQGPC